MKFTVVGSLGNVGKPLAQKLIAQGYEVTIITSKTESVRDIEALGAKAAVGLVNDTEFLSGAFYGSDAVFTMTPPNLGGQNVVANTTAAGQSFAEAIEKAKIKRVVMLSSIGADLPEGNGPIAGLHNIEQIFNGLTDVSFTYLRAGFFYTNFYNDVVLIKGMGIMGANYPVSVRMPLVHPADIASVAAEELQKIVSEKIRYVISDIKTPGEVVAVIGKAIGKRELGWVEFTDEQAQQGMEQAGLPEEIAKLYTEMGQGFRVGKISGDFEKEGAPVVGKIKLDDFAKEFASSF